MFEFLCFTSIALWLGVPLLRDGLKTKGEGEFGKLYIKPMHKYIWSELSFPAFEEALEEYFKRNRLRKVERAIAVGGLLTVSAVLSVLLTLLLLALGIG